MDLEEYKKKALRTDFAEYDNYHTGDVSPRLDYGIVGLVTEAVKALDIVKKTKKDLQPLDNEKMVEELSDLLWYLNITLDELDVSFEDLMQANIEKIARKYPKGESEDLIRGEI